MADTSEAKGEGADEDATKVQVIDAIAETVAGNIGLAIQTPDLGLAIQTPDLGLLSVTMSSDESQQKGDIVQEEEEKEEEEEEWEEDITYVDGATRTALSGTDHVLLQTTTTSFRFENCHQILTD